MKFPFICGCPRDSNSEKKNDIESELMLKTENRSIIFFINTNSGAGRGRDLMNQVARVNVIKEIQCFAIDLMRFATPNEATVVKQELQVLLQRQHPENTRIVVAGGDGSVKWVISILFSLNLPSSVPPIAVMPVGTGNEFSRVTGWGINNVWGTRNLREYIDLVMKGPVFDLDIWNVDKILPLDEEKYAEDSSDNQIVRRVQKHQKMVGFISFGLDAEVSMKYHEYRQDRIQNNKPPSNLYVSRGMHGIWALQTAINGNDDIRNCLQLKVNGLEVELPKGLQNLMLHNCHTSSGGTYFWGDSNSNAKDLVRQPSPPSACDEVIEICGVRSVIHLTSTLLKLTHATRIAQGSDVEITLLKPMACQLDGEPWRELAGSVIKVSLARPHKIRLIGGSGNSLNMHERELEKPHLGNNSEDNNILN